MAVGRYRLYIPACEIFCALFYVTVDISSIYMDMYVQQISIIQHMKEHYYNETGQEQNLWYQRVLAFNNVGVTKVMVAQLGKSISPSCVIKALRK